MAAPTRSELQDLVDAPNETLAVEYKSWLDFSLADVRADLARHIAAQGNISPADAERRVQSALNPSTVSGGNHATSLIVG